MLNVRVSIASLEAFNVLVALRLWGPEWSGEKVLIFCDNWATVCAVNSGAATDPLIRAIIRELWWLCATFDIYLVVRHRPGSNMRAADLLSRQHTSLAFKSKLAQFKAEFNEAPRVIHSKLLAPTIPL